MRNKRFHFFLQTLLMLYVSLYAILSHSAEIGEIAPDFSLSTLDHSTLNLSNPNEEKTISLSSYRGKVVYLDFWASWCPPCLVSIPLYAEWEKTLNPEDSAIITINLDRNTKKAKAFLKRHPVNYVVLTDPKGEVAKEFALPTMPTSYIIDREGRIVFRHEGFKRGDLDLIKKEFNKVISQ